MDTRRTRHAIAAAARAIALCVAALCALCVCARSEADSLALAAMGAPPLRPVTAAFAIEAGGARLADTYLSPMRYSGYHLGIDYARARAMAFDPERWAYELRAGIDFENTVRSARLMALGARLSWGMTRRWTIAPVPALTLGAGGRVALDVGCLYLRRNGNNPASARAAATLDLTALASYRLRLGRLPVTLTYQGALPITGAFFSPDYGELYYEIYLGDRSGLAHAAWWGNYFALDTRLTARMELGGTSLTVGYHGTVRSTHVNNLTTRALTHAVTLGVAVDWLSVASARSGANIITAY